mmetsp:Transcript_4476/g.9419  ORF Transcript_4476/g.9419 Transcript_4476/m.9419 type:complete len:712 (-) Transcript_4476:19-2154(-)
MSSPSSLDNAAEPDLPEDGTTTVTIVESGTDSTHLISLSKIEAEQLASVENDDNDINNDNKAKGHTTNDDEAKDESNDASAMESESIVVQEERDAPATPKQSSTDLSNLTSTTPVLTPNQNLANHTPGGREPLPMLSECLYGVPEDDEEGFIADDVVDETTGHCDESEIWKRQPRVRGHCVNMGHLRRLAASGIPDEGSHRGVVWRLLLGPYLPPDNIDRWQKTLLEKRGRYHSYCNNYFLWNDWNFGHALRVKRKIENRGPLVLRLDIDESYQSMNITAEQEEDDEEDSTSTPTSTIPTRPTPSKMFNNPNLLKDEIPQPIQDAWVNKGKDLHILEALQKSFNALKLPPADNTDAIDDFVESVSLLDEIRKDVVRTHSDLSFFLDPVGDLGRRRYSAIERILFLWAKYNESGVRYVQGMNEIVGALYYVCANDSRTEWANCAEADTFWLLEALLDDMRDVFVPELDAVDTGIRGRISALQDLLERHDPALKEHFVELSIDASFYAVRWLTTLLSREFLLPDTIRLWDAMFASTHKDNFLRYVCVTMLLMIRDQLLSGDFGTCIRLLQRYPTVHMEELLQSSRSLYIYETQVTVAVARANISQHTALLSIKPPPTLIMAFGFKRGIAPTVQKSSSERVSALASTTSNAFKSMFRSMRSWSSITNSEDGNTNQQLEVAPKTPERPLVQPTLKEESPESPDIYMQAILGEQSP